MHRVRCSNGLSISNLNKLKIFGRASPASFFFPPVVSMIKCKVNLSLLPSFYKQNYRSTGYICVFWIFSKCPWMRRIITSRSVNALISPKSLPLTACSAKWVGVLVRCRYIQCHGWLSLHFLCSNRECRNLSQCRPVAT